MSYSWYLGVDAGATKTNVLIKLNNGLTFEAQGPPSNFHNLGLTRAYKNLIHTVNQARQLAGNLLLEPAAQIAVIGWAGLDNESDKTSLIRQFNRQEKPALKTLIVNDAYIALRAVSRVKYGICLIAGTGAQCYGLTPDGNETKAGDWGYLLGDQASGFTFGRAIIREAMKEYDGRSSANLVTPFVREHFKLKSLSQLPAIIYANQGITQIASLAHLLNDAEFSSMPLVKNLVDQLLQDILLSIKAVLTRLVFPAHSPIPLVLAGGLFSNHLLILNPLRQKLKIQFPQLQPIHSHASPAKGALHLASAFLNSPNNTPLPLSLVLLDSSKASQTFQPK